MRARSAVLVLGAVLGGCAPLRPTVPPNPALPPQDIPAPAPAPRATTPSDLGCLSDPAIDAWEQRLRTERPLWVATMTSVDRGATYLPRLREIVAEEGLPPSLALLPVVESSFRPSARGPTGSRGLWQMETHTAKRLGLVVTRRRDDRLHVEHATRAAARYLRALHDRYHDWPLALAAYNAGEGRVDRALRRQPNATFWELARSGHLPRTSRDYVPRFLAVVRVVDHVDC